MSFEIEGLDGFKEMLREASERFPSEKEKEMKRIGMIAEGQIKPLIPVDTGRLRNSVFNQVMSSDTVEVVANTDYAEYVNNGHTLRGGKGFVKGCHYMEKGVQNAEPLIMAEVGRWLSGLFKE